MTDPDDLSEDPIVLSPEDETSDLDDADYEDVIEVNARPVWPLILCGGFIAGVAMTVVINWFMRPDPYDPSMLNARISDLQSEIKTLQQKPDPVIPNVNLNPIRQRLSDLEARPTVDPLSEEIVSRMETLQAEGFQLPEIPDFPDITAIESRLVALETEFSKQQVRLDALAMRSPVTTPTEPVIDPSTLPRFPADVLRRGAAELGGGGFLRRTFSQHVRIRGSDNPDVLISGVEMDLANGKARSALAKFDRLPTQLQALARAWRADMEEALK